MLIASENLILFSRLPGRERSVDLLSFFRLLKDDRLVRAFVHVGGCSTPRCRDWAETAGKFLRSNPYYPFEMLRALAAEREDPGWAKKASKSGRRGRRVGPQESP
ncbi:MAG: hypothetical protein A2W26_13615 [Acidobacteria bacterium RBG_16_64_8]|nr:MAG: hypothetical protein A2W26_13615 [Acidobacteria bacterium RBG_16_64_8]